jgi:hypothetical protein
VRLDGKFDYARWLDGIRRGASFVTNGPMVTMTVDGSGPGSKLRTPAPKRVRIRAEASSQLLFERLGKLERRADEQAYFGDPAR